MDSISRGEIWFADLSDAFGSEQQFRRPVLVVQRNSLNRSSPTTIVVPITSQLKLPYMKAHCILDESCPLCEESMALAEQVRAIDKRRLGGYIGRLKDEKLRGIEQALRYCFGMDV